MYPGLAFGKRCAPASTSARVIVFRLPALNKGRTASTARRPIFADAPAVKMQKTISSHKRASEAVCQTSVNSLNLARISWRRAKCVTRKRSTVTGA
ncbi:MAG: hypothetical protein DMF75_14550 [Acidobacteria bacterium]|nr:MAG: hypothetical protein DMF75_14550 [Acidobacteriota bacterium]